VVPVVQNKEQEEQKRHPDSKENEKVLGRAIEREAQWDLHDAENRDSPAGPAVDMHPERVTASELLDETTAYSLEQDQHINGNTNSMVRVCQVARRADGDESENENDGAEADGKDLKIGMVAHRGAWLTVIESRE
jgi:hypothetical protein